MLFETTPCKILNCHSLLSDKAVIILDSTIYFSNFISSLILSVIFKKCMLPLIWGTCVKRFKCDILKMEGLRLYDTEMLPMLCLQSHNPHNSVH